MNNEYRVVLTAANGTKPSTANPKQMTTKDYYLGFLKHLENDPEYHELFSPAEQELFRAAADTIKD